MPSDNWGTPGRDTFQLEAHEHFLAFLMSDGIEYTPPYVGIQTKLTHGIEPQRVRTWKKLFEKMGILYVTDHILKLTDFGHVLEEQLTLSSAISIENNPAIAEAALSVLSRFQLVNPSTRLTFPVGTDVFPYWVIWKIMRQLDNKLHWEELDRVVLRVMKMDQVPAAIAKIRMARAVPGYISSLNEAELTQVLGQKVDLPQRVRAMSAILSEAGFGGCIIERQQRQDGYRYLNPAHLSKIDQILGSAPIYKQYASEKEWFENYGKLVATAPFSPLPESVKKEVEGYPEEVIESVAESYLVKAKSHREIQEKILKRPAPPRGGGFKAMAILHYLGLDETTKGILKDLPTPPQAEALLKDKAPWLSSNQRQKVVSILEGYKASRQADKAIGRGYFSGETEAESLSSRRVRRQQNKLRDLLLILYEGKCALCDIAEPSLLIASHIVPWSMDKENRLNPANAILLCVLHDKLFESGLISFDDNMNTLISKSLTKSKSKFLKDIIRLSTTFRMPKSNPPQKPFLEYHRREAFSIYNA